MHIPSLHGPRLVLRPWLDRDVDPFVALNADPTVMQHFPSVMSRDETLASLARIREHFAQHGYGVWAVSRHGHEEFLGFVGIYHPTFSAHFTRPESPCLEIAWRLSPSVWGQGFATEGARLALRHAFFSLGVDEVVSLTVPDNTRSRAVMQRLGMQHNPEDDFDHPRLPEGHPLRRHVLYRLPQRLFRDEA
jgi:ribosomal-protein-alanine N-acetyltransferase